MGKKTLLVKLTKAVAWFIGSWWGVLAHTLWFTFWLALDFSVERLTFWVSLEAIFIGIFLLMAANQAELERDRREARERAREMQKVEEDLHLDRKEAKDIQEIKEMMSLLQKDMDAVKKRMPQPKKE